MSQWIALVDNRFDLPRFDKFFEKDQFFGLETCLIVNGKLDSFLSCNLLQCKDDILPTASQPPLGEVNTFLPEYVTNGYG